MEKQLNELVAEPSGEFHKFTRMSLTDFEYLLSQISSKISKQDTQLREAIPARIRLALTLRYLATGDDFQSLHFLFKISPQLISNIIPEVCVKYEIYQYRIRYLIQMLTYPTSSWQMGLLPFQNIS